MSKATCSVGAEAFELLTDASILFSFALCTKPRSHDPYQSVTLSLFLAGSTFNRDRAI
jgi:hypothetical protein